MKDDVIMMRRTSAGVHGWNDNSDVCIWYVFIACKFVCTAKTSLQWCSLQSS